MLCQECHRNQLETDNEKAIAYCLGCWPHEYDLKIEEVIGIKGKKRFYYIGSNKPGVDTPNKITKEFNIPLTDYLTVLKNNNAQQNNYLSEFEECFYDKQDARNALQDLRSYILNRGFN